MKWVRTKVDLEKHIIVPEVNHIYNMESADQYVEDYVFNLSKTTIDKSQPLWDLHLLNVKTSDSEAVGVFRIHHSLGDGTSLISLLLACTRKISDPEALPTVPVKKKKKQEKSKSWWPWRCFVGFLWVCQLLWHTVVDVVMFLATATFLKDTDTPLKGPDRTESTPRRIIHRTVSLDDFKLVKNAMNTVRQTFKTSVFFGVISLYYSLCFCALIMRILFFLHVFVFIKKN